MPNLTLTPQTIRAWHELFSEDAALEFQAALNGSLKQPGRAFFPTPGEVNACLLILKHGQTPPALEVWELINKFARGSIPIAQVEKQLQHNHAAISALRQVGYNTIRYSNIETDLLFRKRDFERLYEDAAKKNEQTTRLEITKGAAVKMLSKINSKLLGKPT